MNPTFIQAGDRETGVACPHCRIDIASGDSVARCGSCGAVQHRACWDTHGCGSYNCAPARRDLNASASDAWHISADDLNNAPPMPTQFSGARIPVIPIQAPQASRRSGWAVAAFVCALAGIPLFGLLTGPAAVILACVAIGQIQQTQRKGLVLACIGLLLGIADAVGWLFLLIHLMAAPSPTITPSPRDYEVNTQRLNSLPTEIGRAMRANVLITRDRALRTVLGSGVILKITNGQALILTNRHVIDPNFSARSTNGNTSDISPVHVIAIDHARSEGTVTWLAPAGIDLAIVSAPCDSKEVRSVEWPARTALTIGAPVFAIGNPNSWGWTHTSGTISQFRRWSIGGRDLDIIQTTAAISAGNSGGGLYDREGRLIGINTWTDDKSVTEGISFTIAIEELIKLTPPIPLQVESTPGEPKP